MQENPGNIIINIKSKSKSKSKRDTTKEVHFRHYNREEQGNDGKV